MRQRCPGETYSLFSGILCQVYPAHKWHLATRWTNKSRLTVLELPREFREGASGQLPNGAVVSRASRSSRKILQGDRTRSSVLDRHTPIANNLNVNCQFICCKWCSMTSSKSSCEAFVVNWWASHLRFLRDYCWDGIVNKTVRERLGGDHCCSLRRSPWSFQSRKNS